MVGTGRRPAPVCMVFAFTVEVDVDVGARLGSPGHSRKVSKKNENKKTFRSCVVVEVRVRSQDVTNNTL